MVKSNKDSKVISFRINDEIRGYDSIRITGDGIESSIISLYEAKRLAREMSLDLIEINSNVNPPILKVDNYEKMIYEMKKNLKKSKPSSKPPKEVQLSVNIAKHDLSIKARKAQEFIEDGEKVKVVLTIKGRDLGRREESKRSILEFITMLENVAIPESMPKDDGNKTIVILKKKG